MHNTASFVSAPMSLANAVRGDLPCFYINLLPNLTALSISIVDQPITEYIVKESYLPNLLHVTLKVKVK